MGNLIMFLAIGFFSLGAVIDSVPLMLLTSFTYTIWYIGMESNDIQRLINERADQLERIKLDKNEVKK